MNQFNSTKDEDIFIQVVRRRLYDESWCGVCISDIIRRLHTHDPIREYRKVERIFANAHTCILKNTEFGINRDYPKAIITALCPVTHLKRRKTPTQ